MPSPFPGMDPWLEKTWGDVHTQLVGRISAQLQPLLPRDLRSRVQEHVTVNVGEKQSGRYYDVRVVERPDFSPGARSTAGGATVAEPLVPELPELADEPMIERFIEIRETGSGQRLVTVIEVLSPTNKLPGVNRDLYLQKQRERKWSDVNLVEIDLLRRGPHVLPVEDEQIPESHHTPYRVSVWRTPHLRQLRLFRVPLRERLPIFPIPLRESDEDVPLDLQSALDYCYEAGGYTDIDYSVDPDPPLHGEDAAWADALPRDKGLR